MTNDKATEKQLNEYLDRLLAGEQISITNEMAEDLRSALELAGKMLQSREEPLPAFKAQLRARLLQQLRQREFAAAQQKKSNNLVEGLQRLLQERWLWPALTGAAVVVLLFVSFSLWQHQTEKAASPTSSVASLPPMAINLSPNLPSRVAPSNLTYSVNTSLTNSSGQAAIYKIQTPEVSIASVTALGRRLGFSGEARSIDGGQKMVMFTGTGSETKQIIVWAASGAVEYGFIDAERQYPTSSTGLPSENEAKRISYDFLERNGLLPPGYEDFSRIENSILVSAGNSYSISQNITGKTMPKAPGYWQVSLPYRIGNMLATGPGSRIETSIGNSGEVLKLVWAWREALPVYSGNIRSSESAYQALTRGQGSIDIPLDSSRLIVQQIKLAYWIDPLSEKQSYLLPVYEFKGECLDKSGKPLENFTGWIDALATTN